MNEPTVREVMDKVMDKYAELLSDYDRCIKDLESANKTSDKIMGGWKRAILLLDASKWLMGMWFLVGFLGGLTALTFFTSIEVQWNTAYVAVLAAGAVMVMSRRVDQIHKQLDEEDNA